MQAYGLLLGALTWIPGPLIALAFSTSRQPGRRWFYCGVAVPMFWVGLGMVIVIVDELGMLSVRDLTAFLLALVVSLATFLSLKSVARSPVRTRGQAANLTAESGMPWLTSLAAILLISSILASLWSMLLAPLSAWDSIDFWAKYASEFANHAISGHRLTFLYDERHPLILSALLGASAVPSKSTDLINFWALPWAGLLFSLCATLFGLCRLVSLSTAASLCVILFVVSMPLLDNHFHLPFYSEVVVSCLLLNSVASFALFLKFKSKTFLCLAAGSVLLLLATRNTGSFYFFVAAIPFIAIVMRRQLAVVQRASRPMLLVSITLAAGAFVLLAATFLSAEQKGDSIMITYASKELIIGLPHADEFFRTIFTAYFLNASFSVAPLMTLVFFLTLAFRSVRAVGSPDEMMWWYVMFCILLGVSAMALSLTTDYGLRFASPGSDTGFSRFSMPIWVLTGMALAGTLTRLDPRNGYS